MIWIIAPVNPCSIIIKVGGLKMLFNGTSNSHVYVQNGRLKLLSFLSFATSCYWKLILIALLRSECDGSVVGYMYEQKYEVHILYLIFSSEEIGEVAGYSLHLVICGFLFL